ncbi:4,5-dihydroxyphthalate decarboxylase [Cryobacterium sp. N21]|uniref:4,5-dihydroxyphthalate decarboxylase n=1 Tax=Cryobacterium sp. N21 TaxID=2048289 RepID=UPI000CE328E0|nr:4,5-dihydroxyphthalate decarboxylase [Cryobacterium sp. N21]
MRLSTLTRPQGANRALIDGDVIAPGFEFDFADEPVLVKGFRKMVRNLEFDVAEMALTTYITAKEHDVAFTALPIFLVRDFHHGATQTLRSSSDRPIADFAGGRLGVNRGYTVTTGVWGRAALAANGLDLESVTWVCSGEEHVAEYAPPANVIGAPEGTTLEEMLLAGELDAVVGAGISHPDVVPLFSDPDGAAAEVLRERGIFPINHLIVVRDELLASNSDVAHAVFEAFAEAKRIYTAQLTDLPTDSRQNRVLARVTRITGADPLPYGLEGNRATLEELIDNAVRQHIIRRRPSLEELFAVDTLELRG